MFEDCYIHGTKGPKPVLWWRRKENLQNFGDFLGALYLERFGDRARVDGDVYRLVGSVITPFFYEENFRVAGNAGTCKSVFWGCGLGQETKMPPNIRSQSVFCGVRGVLTRQLLELPNTVPIGDSAFVLPIIFEPTRAPQWRKSVCVPHIHETKSDIELLETTGAEAVIKPTVESNLSSLLELIDKIASANFVLAGSLHAAIVAASYGVPFSFLDTGHLNLPFKWRDFASSISIPTCFARNMKEGQIIFESLIRPRIELPEVHKILSACPIMISDEYMKKSIEYDASVRTHLFR